MTERTDIPPAEATRRALADSRVIDAISPGVVTCPADAPLTEVADLMASHRIHAVVVDRSDRGVLEPLVVSDLDMANGVLGGVEAFAAGDVAGSPTVSVRGEARLDEAVNLMREYQTAHLLVVDEAGVPVGVVSTLDVARLIAAASRRAAGGGAVR